MPWDPGAEGNDPGVLAQRAEIGYGAQVVLYPAPGGDHSAFALLLSALTDDRFPPAADLSAGSGRPTAVVGQEPAGGGPGIPVRWVPPAERVEHFTGRAEELARLDRWAADPQVSLIGVTAWGGAGKTALVTHWVQEAGGPARRPGVRGVFGWSFYADPVGRALGRGIAGVGAAESRRRGWPAAAGQRRLCWRCCGGCRCCWCWTGWRWRRRARPGMGSGGCWMARCGRCWPAPASSAIGGLVVLTSRFPFADLEGFDGGSARMLEVPPFTPAEGSALLAAAGGGWLAEDERRALVAAVDGHALADRGAGRAAGRPPARRRPGRPARRPGRGGAHRCAGRQGAGVLRRTAGRGGPVPAGRGVAVRPARPGCGGAGGRRA